jgi:hypothetical protein
LAEKYRDRGLVILAVNLADTEAAISSFKSQGDLQQRFLLNGAGVAREYKVDSFPRSFYIDREGVVRAIVKGFSPSMLPETESRIEGLLSS